MIDDACWQCVRCEKVFEGVDRTMCRECAKFLDEGGLDSSCLDESPEGWSSIGGDLEGKWDGRYVEIRSKSGMPGVFASPQVLRDALALTDGLRGRHIWKLIGPGEDGFAWECTKCALIAETHGDTEPADVEGCACKPELQASERSSRAS